MLILIKGAGDIASGIAYRLRRCGFDIAMTDLPKPTAIRRTVCYSEAIEKGGITLEGITAKRAENAAEAMAIIKEGCIAVLPDPDAKCIIELHPDVVVDAILAKRNINTSMTDAPIVIAAGPGFTAGVDCHAVVETMRGHTLGRVYYNGSALPNTGVPGVIGGESARRILRAPKAGIFCAARGIGEDVHAGEVCGYVDDMPMICLIDGMLRGILPDGTPVHQGMKSGDVDPRCKREYCYSISDKALSIGGGVLEAVMSLSGCMRG